MSTTTYAPFETWVFSPDVEEEISYLIQIHEDSRDTEDAEDAPLSRAEAVQQMMQDSDGRDHWSADYRKELQTFGIAVGIFKAKTKEQLARIVSIGRGKKYDFKRGEQFFCFTSWKPLGL